MRYEDIKRGSLIMWRPGTLANVPNENEMGIVLEMLEHYHVSVLWQTGEVTFPSVNYIFDYFELVT